MTGTAQFGEADRIRIQLEHHGLAALTPIEYTVMAMRVGLGFEGRLHSLAEIGKALGIHRNDVFAVEKRALAKLRHQQWTGDVPAHGLSGHQEKAEATPRPYPPREDA